ncbi:hypothetical protein CR513_59911 [Mucuna pruriens]|uniref:Uncharacterized protein n=1 Tax=Mucuna pruriens TaxID=157652 RepID=A0A371E707_MUCPR|nr:hypothetical protein CR513_59911 [Mucuna pruriens]
MVSKHVHLLIMCALRMN